jgi:hypothetical protein
MPSSAFSGPLLRSDFIHVKIEFRVNILNEVGQILQVASGGGLGHIVYDFFLGGCQRDGDPIIMPFQEFISPRQG